MKRKAPSELSDEISEIDQEELDRFKRLRESSKIHILGTYDMYSKRYDFKKEKTEIAMENVFVKAEGMSKEIFLNKLQCTSRKRVHR